MLVLSRKSGEKIHIGNDVVIEIKRITGSRVTVAIEAPREVRILRAELTEKSAGESPTSEAHPLPSAMPSPATVPTMGACLVDSQPVEAGDVGPSVVGG